MTPSVEGVASRIVTDDGGTEGAGGKGNNCNMYMKGGSIVLCSYNVGTPQVCNLPNFHLVSPSNSMSNY